MQRLVIGILAAILLQTGIASSQVMDGGLVEPKDPGIQLRLAHNALDRALGGKSKAADTRIDYVIARINAGRVLRSAEADASQKADAQTVNDTAVAALKSNGSAAPPRPLPSAACDQPAKVVEAMSPDFPESALTASMPMVVLTRVSVDEDGFVSDIAIQKSSGVSAVDLSTYRAAAGSMYSPKRENCKPVPGLYLFRASFNP